MSLWINYPELGVIKRGSNWINSLRSSNYILVSFRIATRNLVAAVGFLSIRPLLPKSRDPKFDQAGVVRHRGLTQNRTQNNRNPHPEEEEEEEDGSTARRPTSSPGCASGSRPHPTIHGPPPVLRGPREGHRLSQNLG